MKEWKKEGKKKEEWKRVKNKWVRVIGAYAIDDKYEHFEPHWNPQCRVCVFENSVQECYVLPYHGELLQLMQQEVGPLGLCFLLLWFPTDCLCPGANRISHASFPMVLCPVLALWWMELHTEEWVCLEVCPVLVGQQGELQPQAFICFGQCGHSWCGQVDKRTSYVKIMAIIQCYSVRYYSLIYNVCRCIL